MINLVSTSPQYAELWQKWRGELNSLRYNPLAGNELESLRSRMKACSSDLSNLKAAEEFQFFIKYGTDLVGTVSLKNISHMMSYGEIGYGIGEDYQGKGFGTEGVRAFVTKIFSETPLRRLFAYVAEENIASRRLLENVGFVQEGICRDHFLINGKPTNEVLYGLLRSDFTSSSLSPETVRQPHIKTARLILEPYKETDVEDIFDYASRPEITKFLLWEPHKTLEDSKAFLQWVSKSTRRTRGNLFFVFAIRLQDTGRVIGSIDFKNPQPWIGQMDYALHVDHWGKGLVPEAATALRDWAFASFPELVRLQAYCEVENRASARVMEKVGMTFEGIRKKSFKSKGRIVDLAHYALVKV